MVVDLFLVYSFIKRLATPFNKWKAYELGIIDEKGEILKGADERRTVKERDAFGKFDLMLLKLKKLLAKIPGGSSRLASYAAALWLIKEHKETDAEMITEEVMETKLLEYIAFVEQNSDIDTLFEEMTAGAGGVAGLGVGPDGEPGVTKKQANKYKKKNEKDKPTPFKRFSNMV